MCAGLSPVRTEVISNLSTTICSLSPEPFAISLKRLKTASRAQPGPRLGSSHEAMVSRVPHATSLEMSARIPFSSTVERRIAPVGRARIFGAGDAFAGSAGSCGAAVSCAVAAPADTKNAARHAQILVLHSTSSLVRFMLSDDPGPICYNERGILPQSAAMAAVFRPAECVLTFFVYGEADSRAVERAGLQFRGAGGQCSRRAHSGRGDCDCGKQSRRSAGNRAGQSARAGYAGAA